MIQQLFTRTGFVALSLMVAACGSVATPEFQPVETEEIIEVAEADLTEEPTETIEVIATEELPTATPEPTATAIPTVVTEEATEVVTEEAIAADDFSTLIAEAIANGDPVNGQAVYNQQYTTAVGPWICASCHSVDESQLRLVGPPMWGIYERAEERIAESGDADPVEYVRNSILMPTAYIVPADAGGPYPENLMPPNYGEVLTEQELNDVVAYILTLGNPNAE